jgi:hypothetical protein
VADFRIVGRIEQIAPRLFIALAAAVCDVPDDFEGVMVDRRVAASRQGAIVARDEMIRGMGEVIAARGDRVVDVEEE